MRHLQLTLDSPAQNLALDEALLDAAEAGETETDVLRLWELPTYCVVLGRSSNAEVEVDLDACQGDGVPVLRRASGGGTIVAGPGCLMYSLVLGFSDWPELPSIDQAHRWVLAKISDSLKTDRLTVLPAGTSDLSICLANADIPKKISGNAMRRKRRHLLYHGTLLYDFDLSQISRLLATPTRVPDYRDDRAHREFTTNLPLDRNSLIQKLLAGWQAEQPLENWPELRMLEIAQTKYTSDPIWVLNPATT